MSDQTVTVKMMVEGNAKDATQAIGEQVKQVSKAFADANQKLDEFGRKAAASADLGGVVLAQGAAKRLSRMEEQAKVKAVVKEVLPRGSAAEEDIPRATLDAEFRNRQRMATAFARDEARYAREQRAQQRDLEKARAARVQPEEEKAAGGYQNPLAGTGFARVAAPIFVLHAFTQVAEGIEKELERIAKEGVGAKTAGGAVADMLANVAGAAAKSVPIIGGLVETFEKASEIFSGELERRIQHEAAVRQVTQNVSVARAGIAAYGQAEQSVRGVEADQAAAEIQARAARSQAGLLQAAPGLVQYLNPRVEPGQYEIGPGTAAARQGAFDAQSQAAAARDVAADRQRRSAELAARAKTLEDQTKRAADEAQSAQNRAKEDEQRLAGRSRLGAQATDVVAAAAGRGVGVGATAQFDADTERARQSVKDAAEKTAKAQELATRATEAGKENIQAQKAAQDALTKAVEAEGAARRANLDVQKDKLNLLKSEEDAARSAARTLGAMNEAELQSALAAIQQLKQFGISSLTDQQRSLVRQTAPEFIGKVEEQLGQQGTAKQIQEETGRRLLGPVEKERQALAGTITIQAKLDDAQVKEQLVKAMSDAAEPLKAAFLQLAKNAVIQATLDLQQQKIQERLQQQQTK